jgi:hypothetical protein
VAKLTKTVIKSIVKECLVEILSEGIGSASLTESSGHTKNNQKERLNSSIDERRKSAYTRRIGLDKIEFGKSDKELKNKNFEKKVEEAASSMTSDPVLSSILADTAMTTLQEQIGAESSGPGGMSVPSARAGDVAARTAASSTPEDMFGDSAAKWAQLAFADPVSR